MRVATHSDAAHRAVYRATGVLRLVGVVGLAFAAYVFSYNAGIAHIALFARVGDFPLSEPGTWLYLAVMTGLAFAALWLSAVRVTVTDQAITSSAPGRRIVIPWNDITEVVLWRGPQLRVKSARSTIRISGAIVGFGRLKAQLLQRVDPRVVRERRIWWLGQ